MYKVNGLEESLKTFDGKPITSSDGKPLLRKTVLTNLLGSYTAQGANAGVQLLKAYDLGLKIYNGGDSIDVDDDQWKFLKIVVLGGKMYSAIVIGQTLKFLEGFKPVVDTDKKV